MNKTKIEWCDSTCNPVCGCTYGCEFCYARRINNRFQYVKDFLKPQFFPERLKQLYSKKPKNIFMDSMSDIADWKYEWLQQVETAIRVNHQHKYLFLTKRPQFMSETGRYILQTNVWNGATITKESEVARFNSLPAFGNRFVSIEPILEDLQLAEKHNLFFKSVDWVIIGAETGNRRNKVIPKLEWIKKIVSECEKHTIPVFMKDSLRPIVKEVNMLRQLPEGLKK